MLEQLVDFLLRLRLGDEEVMMKLASWGAPLVFQASLVLKYVHCVV